MLSRKGSSKLGMPSVGVKTEWVWDEEAGQLEPVSKGSSGISIRSNPDTNWERSLPLGRSSGSGQAFVGGKVSAGTTVELDDVKRVAVDCVSSEMIRKMSRGAVENFDRFYQSKEVDVFLGCLLRYMKVFFALEHKGNEEGSLGVLGKTGQSEALQANHQVELKRWSKALAEAYCRIILGQGREEQHHLRCGRSRLSRTKSDQEFFEVFYEFVMSVVWVTFHRREWPSIHKEVGRLLKTLPFNKEIVPEVFDEDDSDESQDVAKTTSKSYGVGILKSLRSPVMTSLLPTSKESAPWSFHSSHRPPSQASEGTANGTQCNGEVEQRNGSNAQRLCVGIIGTPMCLYNKWTLLPLEDQVEVRNSTSATSCS